MYRNEKLRLPQFFPDLEELLHNLKAFKKETILFGDFKIDTLKDRTDEKKYESMLTAYNFQIRNFEPIRVTPKTRTCLDHFISSNYFSTKSLKKRSAIIILFYKKLQMQKKRNA